MAKGRRKLVAEFAGDLSDWSENGHIPGYVDREAASLLEAQRKRIRDRGLEVECRVTPRGPCASDDRQRFRQGCRREWRLMRDGKKYYREDEAAILAVTADGEGERLANYCFLREYKLKQEDMLRQTGRCALAGIVTGFFVALALLLFLDRIDYAILLTYPIAGGIFGYVLFLLYMLGVRLRMSVRILSGIKKTSGTRVQISTVVETFAGSFSYEVFEEGIVLLLREILFAEDVKKVAGCEQKILESSLGDIVDAVYCGMMGFRGYQAEGSVCTLNLDVYMRDTYDTGRGCRRQEDVFHLTVRRDFGREPDSECGNDGWIVEAVWKD